MALNWQAPAGGNYDDIMYAYLKAMEVGQGVDERIPTLVNGHPTIGIGFNLLLWSTTI